MTFDRADILAQGETLRSGEGGIPRGTPPQEQPRPPCPEKFRSHERIENLDLFVGWSASRTSPSGTLAILHGLGTSILQFGFKILGAVVTALTELNVLVAYFTAR